MLFNDLMLSVEVNECREAVGVGHTQWPLNN